jgi:hypothetical protein
MTLITMYDAADPAVVRDVIPAGAQAVAGYVGPAGPSNHFVTFPAVVGRFYPHAHCFSIAAQSFLLAACLDIESGDATPAQAPGWFHFAKAAGHWRPCFYANASTMPQVEQQLQAAGIPRAAYRLWVAAYPGTGPNVPPGFDAHQYIDHGPRGENYDISVCLPDFFGPPPAPKPPPASPWQFGFTKGFNVGFNAGWNAR